MINSDKFSKRLKLIMDTNKISATQFAEILGIPRSSISHLLSGRNKPSLEFVLKVLKNFSDVELYWLMNGDGIYPKLKEIKKENTTLFSKTNIEQVTEIEKKDTNLDKNVREAQISDEIDRIVIFFKDGTFKNYSN